jgi:hypothetical protein
VTWRNLEMRSVARVVMKGRRMVEKPVKNRKKERNNTLELPDKSYAIVNSLTIVPPPSLIRKANTVDRHLLRQNHR